MVPTVVETNIDTVEEIQAAGGRAVFGDATRAEILEAAGLETATFLIITVPKAETTFQVMEVGLGLTPHWSGGRRSGTWYRVTGGGRAGMVCVDEAEAAVALAEAVMKRMPLPTTRRFKH